MRLVTNRTVGGDGRRSGFRNIAPSLALIGAMALSTTNANAQHHEPPVQSGGHREQRPPHAASAHSQHEGGIEVEYYNAQGPVLTAHREAQPEGMPSEMMRIEREPISVSPVSFGVVADIHPEALTRRMINYMANPNRPSFAGLGLMGGSLSLNVALLRTYAAAEHSGQVEELEGSGMAYTAGARINFGFGAFGRPFQLTMHFSGGYRNERINQEVELGGIRTRVDIDNGTAFVHTFGFELINLTTDRMPTNTPHDPTRFMFERFGVTFLSDPQNPIVFAGFGGNEFEAGSLSSRWSTTVFYDYLFGHHGFGIEVAPFRLNIHTHGSNVFLSPVARFETVLNGHGYLEIIEVGGEFGYLRHNGIGIVGKAGYRAQLHGEHHETPDTPFGALNIVIPIH